LYLEIAGEGLGSLQQGVGVLAQRHAAHLADPQKQQLEIDLLK
jgi:hypothetical protein